MKTNRFVSAFLLFLAVLIVLVAALLAIEFLIGFRFSLFGSRVALFGGILLSAFFAGHYRWSRLAQVRRPERAEKPVRGPAPIVQDAPAPAPADVPAATVEDEPPPQAPRRRAINAGEIALREQAVPAVPIQRPVIAKAAPAGEPAKDAGAALPEGPEELDMADAAHVEWVKAQRDPALWHLAAMAAFAYRGDPHDFLLWVLEQPETDRATAGWMFLWVEGARFLQGETDFPLPHFPSERVVDLLSAICRRSLTAGFGNDRLGLDADFEPEREACVDLIAKGQVAEGLSAPVAVVGRPFAPPRIDRRFALDDGLIVRLG